VQEDVDAGACLSSLLDLLTPPVVIELGPVSLGPRLSVSTQLLPAAEHPVPDEIGLQEGGSTVVQRLKDDLRVSTEGQVDSHDHETVLEDRAQCFDSLLLSAWRLIAIEVGLPHQPRLGLPSEEGVSVNDSMITRPSLLRIHRLREPGPVVARWPELEPLRLPLILGLRIDYEFLQICGGVIVPSFHQHLVNGVEQNLKRCHPLLPVHDGKSRHVAGFLRPTLVHHSAEKVVWHLRLLTRDQGLSRTTGESRHVLPQRSPLPILVPDVWALVGRDLVMHLALEEVPRRQRGCHQTKYFSRHGSFASEH
jgi:hypothetical protein